MGTTIALGIFDGVHTGHRRVLENAAGYAAEHGAKAAVCTFDTSTISTKGADFLPIYSDEIKREKIQALGITEIHSLDFTKVRDISSESFITDILVSQLHAENVVCGLDFRFGRHASGGIEELEKILKNAEVVVEDEVDSSKINVGCKVKILDIEYNEEVEYKTYSK